MKLLKSILCCLILIPFISCKKVKLEDDEYGKLLIGKWKYDYSGYHTSSIDFVRTLEPYEDFEIEFLEGGKICINENGMTSSYNIVRFGEVFQHYSKWRRRIHYGKDKDNLTFEVSYYSEDSIMLTKFPHETPYAPSQYNGLNVFKRIE